MLRRFLLSAAAVALAAAAAAAVAPPPLRPSRVEIGATPTHGPQYLAADVKGRLHLLRGHRPLFFRLDADGSAEPWGEKASAQAETLFRPPLKAAALAPDGRRWLLVTGDELLEATETELEILPNPGWEPLAAAYASGHPLLAVLPSVPQHLVGQVDLDRPPFLVEFTGSKWPLLADDPPVGPDAEPATSRNGLMVERAVHLAPAHPKGFWMAHQYLYRLHRFSPAGRREFTVSLGPESGARHVEDEDELERMEANLRKQAEAVGMKDAKVTVFTAKIAIAGIAEGEDGRLYAVSPAGYLGSSASLDRYDPLTLTLERAPLALDYAGLLSVASTPDGLWLAAQGSGQQVWRLSWASIEGAHWQVVEGVEVDGAVVSPAPEE